MWTASVFKQLPWCRTNGVTAAVFGGEAGAGSEGDRCLELLNRMERLRQPAEGGQFIHQSNSLHPY